MRLRALAALALLGVAADHLEELTAGHYAAIPTIGTLFSLDVAAATFLALVLLLPAWRLPGRAGRAVPALAALAGIAVAAGSLVALLVSEHTPLFGFMESGYRLTIVVAIACEAAAVLLLATELARPVRRPRRRLQHAAPVRAGESVSLCRSPAPGPHGDNRADANWNTPATEPAAGRARPPDASSVVSDLARPSPRLETGAQAVSGVAPARALQRHRRPLARHARRDGESDTIGARPGESPEDRARTASSANASRRNLWPTRLFGRRRGGTHGA